MLSAPEPERSVEAESRLMIRRFLQGSSVQLVGFVTLPLLSLIVTIVAIPILVSVGGAQGWTAIAIGQGVGAIGSHLIAFGWGVIGPHRIATTPADRQSHVYRLSFMMRAAIGMVVLPLLFMLSCLVAAPPYAFVAAVTSIGFGLQGFSPGWYLIGQGRPFFIALIETGPRVLGQVIAALSALWTESLLLYAVVTIGVEAVLVVTAWHALSGRRSSQSLRPEVFAAFREQWPLALSAVAGAGYSRAAVPIVAGVSYTAAAPFAALERMQMLARGGLRPFVSFFQSWNTRPGLAWGRVDRRLLATSIVVALAISAGAAVALLLPILDDYLFVGEIEIPHLAAMYAGVAISCMGASYCTSLFYLVPAGRTGLISASSILGSLLAVPLLLVLTPAFAAEGAMGSLAIAESVVLVWQLCAIWLRPSSLRVRTIN